MKFNRVKEIQTYNQSFFSSLLLTAWMNSRVLRYELLGTLFVF